MNASNSIPSINDFYIKDSLYVEHEITKDNRDEVLRLKSDSFSLDCYCPYCKIHSIFLQDQIRSSPARATVISSPEDPLTIKRTFLKQFYCSRNNLHSIVFLIKIENSRICKIGQYPSVADLAEVEGKKYKKILGDYYVEYNKAIALFAHVIGVGSFVYLRRIVENFIIMPTYEKCKRKDGWEEEPYRRARNKEKIDILKSDLPSFLVENHNIYSILSKGLHSLNEQECLRYFPVLQGAINVVLSELNYKKEEEEKRQALKS